jgi:FeS assembly protein IscX
MKWLDIREIAIALADTHPDVDPARINFVDLYNRVLALEGFDDDRGRAGEKVLEAIQAAWIEEAQ